MKNNFPVMESIRRHMYRISDKGAAIAEVQRLLNTTQTGVYDENTQKIVAEQQKVNNLPITGSVDYKTFLSILKLYSSRRFSEAEESPFIPKARFPIKKGSLGSEIEYINILLKNILEEYKIDYKIPYGRYYGYDTENAVIALGRLFDIPAENGVTLELYNRILIENKAIAIKKSFR